MLSPLLAHAGEALQPHDLWGAWHLDPLLLLTGGAALAFYARGRRRGPRSHRDVVRARCVAGAAVAIAVALVSPLDAMAGSLASAHMVQHLLLVLVAAPLLVLGAPAPRLLRGMPPDLRRTAGGWRRRLRRAPATAWLAGPAAAWVLHVGVLWFWHGAGPYGAALDNELVHILEHVTFLATGVLFWHAVAAPGRRRVVPGLGILLLFGMAMQSTFLSLLLTFAEAPWYGGYASTTAAWGLTPLADQHLAGVIMWVPAGLVYVVAALALLVTWLGETERQAVAA